MSTVAEGVETLDQLDTATLAGCEEVQGFYFGKPVPAGEVKAVLAGCRTKLRVDRSNWVTVIRCGGSQRAKWRGALAVGR